MRLAERLVTLPYQRFCGRTIDGRRLGRVLGAGGSAVTFEAVDPHGRLEVAKLLRPIRASHDREAVWREVSALERAPHPAVPRWRGILRDGRAYFVLLSRMPGSSLDQWLFERRHPFGSHEVACIGFQLVGALSHLHEHGVAHGDVRPANVLYDGERVSLVDFGMCACAEDRAAAFNERRAADVAGFADIVLHLLYSSYRRLPGAPAGEWRDELILSHAQRGFLEDSFARPESMAADDMRRRFEEAFRSDVSYGSEDAVDLSRPALVASTG